MSDHPYSSYWIPLLLTLVGMSFAVGWAVGSAHPIAAMACYTLSSFAAVVAGVLAYKTSAKSRRRSGGTGGSATVEGTGSSAVGGDGGNVGVEAGGEGGNATVRGNNSSAKGGRGGAG
jgi:hypothetical protein